MPEWDNKLPRRAELVGIFLPPFLVWNDDATAVRTDSPGYDLSRIDVLEVLCDQLEGEVEDLLEVVRCVREVGVALSEDPTLIMAMAAVLEAEFND